MEILNYITVFSMLIGVLLILIGTVTYTLRALDIIDWHTYNPLPILRIGRLFLLCAAIMAGVLYLNDALLW